MKNNQKQKNNQLVDPNLQSQTDLAQVVSGSQSARQIDDDSDAQKPKESASQTQLQSLSTKDDQVANMKSLSTIQIEENTDHIISESLDSHMKESVDQMQDEAGSSSVR